MSELTDRLSAIPEVERALLIGKNGVAVDDSSYDGEFLAAHAVFLGQFGARLAGQLGVGELKSAVVHGSEHHLFLYESRSHFLGVTAKGSANVNALDSEIRRILTQK